MRTHHCGELRGNDTGKSVTLCGWVATRRDHGGLIFLDLRDRYGITQLVVHPESSPSLQVASKLRQEYVIRCQGKVQIRPKGMENPQMPTGQIEVSCTELEILSEARTPPFQIEDEKEVSETLRLKYRYLDLRRPSLQKNLIIRAKALSVVRRFLDENQFLEVETPILYKSTPEGARDFIVPSRMNPKMFYALPQSPQILKQLLMIAGFDRYYQIARCFRDEDLRADRQPEFSQIDIETSFLTEVEIYQIIEAMIVRVWKEVKGITLKTPFPKMTYKQAVEEYGTDKPDVRFDLKIQNLSQYFQKSQFNVFASALKAGSIRALHIEGQAENFSRKDLDELTEEAKRYGAKGLVWIKIQSGGEWNSPAAKFISEAEKNALTEGMGLKTNDLLLVVADSQTKTACFSLGVLRLKVGEKLGIAHSPSHGEPRFLWVHEFPLLEFSPEDKRYFALHHPFTRPTEKSMSDFLSGKNLDQVEAAAYDLVLNGVEIGGGSLRIYRSDVQQAMFAALGLTEAEAKDKFGFFLEALQYGTPPHGGLAFGVDRLAAILCDAGPIRDVMAFPKTQRGQCLMSGCPSELPPEQLVELGISVRRGENP